MLKEKLIIDTDPGIDDAVAIAIALFDEKVDVKLITTVAGNVSLEKVTYNARKLLKFFKKENVPVAKGCSEPLIEKYKDAADIHGESGMDGYEFEEPDVDILKEHAVIAMKNLLMESDEKITILAIGPLTNIAVLLKMYPEVKERIKRVVFMGGSLTRGNRGVMTEFNIGVDPEAAHIVVNSGLDITMVGLDIGWQALIYEEEREKLKTLNKTGEMAYSLFKKYRSASFDSGLHMYDPTAIAYIIEPELFEGRNTYLDIELHGNHCKGLTVVDLDGCLSKKSNAYVLTKVDGDKFRKWFVDALSKCN